MNTHTEYLMFHTAKRRELVHLTPTLEKILAKSGIAEGFMLVSAMHITAGVFVNDDESGPVIVPVTKGRLDLGTWQRVIYAGFDGQRDKRVIVKTMGE